MRLKDKVLKQKMDIEMESKHRYESKIQHAERLKEMELQRLQHASELEDHLMNKLQNTMNKQKQAIQELEAAIAKNKLIKSQRVK